jgi:hypothetical protein
MFNSTSCIILRSDFYCISHSEFSVLAYNIPAMAVSEEKIPEVTLGF